MNGKVRTELTVPSGTSEEDIKAQALEDETIITWIKDKEVKRIIYVKDRLVI